MGGNVCGFAQKSEIVHHEAASEILVFLQKLLARPLRVNSVAARRDSEIGEGSPEKLRVVGLSEGTLEVFG